VALLFVVAGIAAGIVVLTGDSGGDRVARDNPTGVVQQFLIAVSSGNGDSACGYLATGEQRHVEDAAGKHVDCDQAFMDAQLEFTGKDYLDDLRAVHFEQSRKGDRATVVATNGRSAVAFALVPASTTEINEQRYQPPATNWRIARGALAVVRPVP
jgi:hypothetical protein